jgi:hypothetical protein
VIRPVRESVLVFAPTANPSAAVPDPELFDSVIHAASDCAVHPQLPDDSVTLMLDEPPSADADCDEDDKV